MPNQKPGGGIYGDNIRLSDDRETAEGRFWLKAGSERAVRLKLKYEGQGDILLKGIHIAERRLFRCTYLAAVLLSFLVLDGLWLFFAWPSGQEGFRRKKAVCAGLLALTGFASLPCFMDVLYGGHDISFHLQRIAAVAEELSYGQFPVRMMTGMLNGYGYANSLYYCDLFLYLPALLYNLLLPMWACYYVYLFLCNLLTALIAYHCFFRLSGKRFLSFCCSGLWVLSAYRMTCVLIRSAVGEYTAMIFLPLALVGMYEILVKEERKGKGFLYLGVGMAGIIMSHILTAEMAAGFLAIVCLVCAGRAAKKHRLLALLKAVGCCVGLTAWFLIPLLDMFGRITVEASERVNLMESHGAYLIQIFSGFLSSWGVSAEGMQGEMPLTIGLSLTAGLMLTAFALLLQKAKEPKETYKAAAGCLWLGLLAIFMASDFFPWDSLEGWFGKDIAQLFSSVQFPWRYLGLASILLVAALLFVYQAQERVYRKYLNGCMALLLLLSVVTIGDFYVKYFSGGSNLSRNYIDRFQSVSIGSGEYLPLGTETGSLMDITGAIGEGVAVKHYGKTEGAAIVSCKNEMGEERALVLPLLNYPYYQALDQDQTELEIVNEDNNRLGIVLPAYFEGEITVGYAAPFYWRVFEAISLLTAAGVGYVILPKPSAKQR